MTEEREREASEAVDAFCAAFDRMYAATGGWSLEESSAWVDRHPELHLRLHRVFATIAAQASIVIESEAGTIEDDA